MQVLAQPSLWAGMALSGAALALWGAGMRATGLRGRLAAVAAPVLPWVALAVGAVLVAPGLGADLRLGLVGVVLAVAGWFVTYLLALELRAPVFTARPAAARIGAYEVYFKAAGDLADVGRAAVVALNRRTGLPPPVWDDVSTPGPARSGPAEADAAADAGRPS